MDVCSSVRGVVVAVWQVDVQKRLGTEYWTNVYHVNKGSQADAQAWAGYIIILERQFHLTTVEFVSYRVAPYPGPSEGTITPVNLFGQAAAGDALPLFNVLRVDFPVATGRPSRKYYRLPLREGDQANGLLLPASRDGYQQTFDDVIFDPNYTGWCDVDGQPILAARVNTAVGMRQLRRGSKRKLEPVIPIA